MLKMDSKEIAPVVLRVSMALVFLYFGVSQLNDPSSWSGFVPEFATNFGLSANNLVVLNGFVELVLGLFILVGIYVKISSLLLAIHLFGITLSLGFSPLGIRDFGLSLATFVIYLLGPDKYTIDHKYSNKKSSN